MNYSATSISLSTLQWAFFSVVTKWTQNLCNFVHAVPVCGAKHCHYF